MARCDLLIVVVVLLSITGCSQSQLLGKFALAEAATPILAPSLPRVAVHWISPRGGSVAGGTRVYVGGSEFQTDSYTGANLVFIGDIPCDVVAYTVTRFRLECITRPYPGAVEGQSSPWLPIRVISGGIQVLPTSSSTTFRYTWNSYRTPQVGQHETRMSLLVDNCAPCRYEQCCLMLLQFHLLIHSLRYLG